MSIPPQEIFTSSIAQWSQHEPECNGWFQRNIVASVWAFTGMVSDTKVKFIKVVVK